MTTLSFTFDCNGSKVTVSTTAKEGETFEQLKARHDAVVAAMEAAC